MIITGNEEYEILARMFNVETGLMAPGKDDPTCTDKSVRIIAWDKWITLNIDIIKKTLNAVSYIYRE